MNTCQFCGEEIEWRTMDGRRVPMHPNGGWECSAPRRESNRERSCWRTKCPRCGDSPIYFVRHNGGSVWFDELGQPWPIHGCFADDPASRALERIRTAAAGINRQTILGIMAANQVINSQIGLAVELFNGRRACVIIASTTPLVVGSPIAVFRDADRSNGVLLTEHNSRLPILGFIAAGALGLAEGWADCASYGDIESPVETIQLTYAELLQLHADRPEQFADLARIFSLEDESAKARETYRNRHKYAGKIICAARVVWEQLVRERRNRQNFAEYFLALTGQRPSSHGQSCAKAYRELVLTGRISEEDYDFNPGTAIELGARIVSKVLDELDHPAVAEAVAILRRRSPNSIRELTALLARLYEDTVTGQILLRAAGQVERKGEAMSFAEAARLVENIEATSNHNVMVDSLVNLAGSTPHEKIASHLAAAAAKIHAALKRNTGMNGHRRFSDELITEWMKLQSAPQVITVESLKADHAAAVQRVKELTAKLESAGLKVPPAT